MNDCGRGGGAAATYSGNPAGSVTDAIRFEVGDTDMRQPLLSDAELAYIAGSTSSMLTASVRALEAMIARAAQYVDESVGAVSFSYSNRLGNLQMLLALVRRRLLLEDCVPYAGGISLSDKYAVASDPDRRPPKFTVDEDDYPDVVEGNPTPASSGPHPGI